jgi:protein-disulfide isomerase-like protein with CxxC motif
MNDDIRQPDILAGYAGQFEVDSATFLEHFQSDEMKQATLQDFALAQRFEVNGFPTLVLLKDRAGYQITVGYQKADAVIANIERALAHEGAPA